MKIQQLQKINTYNFDPKTAPINNIYDAKNNKVDKLNSLSQKLTKPTFDYGTRAMFQACEYNLQEIGVIEDVDSFVRQAFQKKTALMFKEGFEYRGKNKKVINYIKQRIRQIENATGVSWTQLLRDTGYYLLSRSNAFWVIVRDKEASGGVRKDGKTPIAGFFPLPPETVHVRKHIRNGEILEYRQWMPDGRIQNFDPEDIVHFFAYKKHGLTFGTPYIVAVKDDVRALRRIEENVELLIYQTLFPIFQYKIGTPEKPAGQIRLQTGELVDEVTYVRGQISFMPSEGGIVTPERHDIQYIGAEGKALKAREYLDYFRDRVFAGLGCSAVDFGYGDTSNRSTSDTMSRIMIDSVKDFQEMLSGFINHVIFRQLLEEANFSFDPFEDENNVEFKFREIDIETQLKKNVNAQLLYNGNVIEIDEARHISGYEPIMPENESDMFSKRVTIPEIREKTKSAEKIAGMGIDAQQEMHTEKLKHEKEQGNADPLHKAVVAAHTSTIKTSRSPTGGTSKTVTKVHPKAFSRIKAMSSPTNQHGTKTGPQASRKDSYIGNDSIASNYWNILKNEVIDHSKKPVLNLPWLKTLVGLTLANTRDRYIKLTENEIIDGLNSYSVRATPDILNSAKSYFIEKITIYMNRFEDAIKKELERTIKNFEKTDHLTTQVKDLFDRLEYRLNFFDSTERQRAYNLGRVLALKNSGETIARVKTNLECEICSEKSNYIDIEHLSFDDLPPHHSNCDCGVFMSDFTKKEESCILKVKKQLRNDHKNWTKEHIISSAIAICRSSIEK